VSPSPTQPAPPDLSRFRAIALPAQLLAAGVGGQQIAANLAARHWRKIGPAIVLHYRELTPAQQLRLALLGHGPAAVLASFTALREYGLVGWETTELHILAPAEVAPFQNPELPLIVLHRMSVTPHGARPRVEAAAAAAVRAGASTSTERIACGLLAATVQQGITQARILLTELRSDSSLRHRAAMVAAVRDMQADSDALADLELPSLCRAAALPMPALLRRRADPDGRLRYLEAVWDVPHGDPLVLQVDGALHLSARRWWEHRLHPSDLVASATGVYRVPSAVLRHEPGLVLGVLRRVLDGHRAIS
jgi:hypothetical protein